MSQERPQSIDERLEQAYRTMLARVHERLEQAEERTLPVVRESIDKAREAAHELGELTREEAERVADYVRQDLHDAIEYASTTGEELRQWLKFDLEQIGERLVDLVVQVADQSRIELEQFVQTARKLGERHTGEVTGAGLLVCEKCGEELHFKRTSRIPPCPRCHATYFRKEYR